MKYNTKCILIGRKKDYHAKEDETLDDPLPFIVEVKLFDIKNAHKTGELPKEILQFKGIKKVYIKGFDMKYCPRGNDLVLNNIESVEIEQTDNQSVTIKKE